MIELSPTRVTPVDIGKPRMRGWLHTYAFFVALVCAVVLVAIASIRPGTAPVAATAVYGATICGLFGVSALYHRRVWSPRGYQIMRRLDHSMIFLFIAGTYTPLCALLLPSHEAETLLAIVWCGAAAGVMLKMAWPHGPRWTSAPLYVALGWVVVAVMPDIVRRGGVAVLVLLIAGGVFYSVGGVLYALRRPNPWPGVFGHHEVFHTATLVAAICHQVAIYLALLCR